jgi:hypothetical protein
MQIGQRTVTAPVGAVDRDWDASLAAFAAHHLDVIPFWSWHGQPRASRFQTRGGLPMKISDQRRLKDPADVNYFSLFEGG